MSFIVTPAIAAVEAGWAWVQAVVTARLGVPSEDGDTETLIIGLALTALGAVVLLVIGSFIRRTHAQVMYGVGSEEDQLRRRQERVRKAKRQGKAAAVVGVERRTADPKERLLSKMYAAETDTVMVKDEKPFMVGTAASKPTNPPLFPVNMVLLHGARKKLGRATAGSALHKNESSDDEDAAVEEARYAANAMSMEELLRESAALNAAGAAQDLGTPRERSDDDDDDDDEEEEQETK